MLSYKEALEEFIKYCDGCTTHDKRCCDMCRIKTAIHALSQLIKQGEDRKWTRYN